MLCKAHNWNLRVSLFLRLFELSMKLFLSFLVICLAAFFTYSNLAQKAVLQGLVQLLNLRKLTFNRPFNTSTSLVSSLPFTPPQVFIPRSASNMTIPRKIHQHFLAIEQSEGAGARVRRSIGTPNLRQFSPFLMLDHFTVHPGAGFPDHPHRGQETITYLLKGAVDHEDFAGNAGTIHAGDLQFMTAGRGIMHAEMPNQGFEDNVGMQLWVDLPAKLKKCEPRYRDLKAAEIPTINIDDDKVTVKVISGQSHGTDSVKELAYTPVWLLDVEIKPSGRIAQALPVGWNAFAYIWEGTADFGVGKDKVNVGKFYNVVFEREGDEVVVEVPAEAKDNARLSECSNSFLDVVHRC